MTVRPIIFSASMVRALLAGSKTMTRRVLKPQPVQNDAGLWTLDLGRRGFSQTGDVPATMRERGWLRFAPGDLLWVRENHTIHTWDEDGAFRFSYEADGARSWFIDMPEDYHERLDQRLRKAGVALDEHGNFAFTDAQRRLLNRPSIFLPRDASRLTLAVTAVKVDRLQDISEADAIAEGIHPLPQQSAADPSAWWESAPGQHQARTAVESFQLLWNSINGPGAWEANPWVVALTFTVHHANVDAMPAKAPAP